MLGAMTGPHERARPGVLAVSGAGAAFAVGMVAALELSSLALPGPRAVLRTWGPITTVLAGGAIVVVGFPVSLLVEAASRRTPSQFIVALGGYLMASLVAGVALVALWRAVVNAAATPADLAGELGAVAAGALAIWAGARLAERFAPAPLLAFGVAALAAVTVATALVRA